jgi:putative Ca2+/H+ antiporter (TMEM165/GDT1 family)
MGSLSVLLAVFAIVFVVELPDKTLVATLVLSSRYRPAPVLVGVGVAFALQMGLAVTVGGLLSLLPGSIVPAVVAVMFAIGAILLWRESGTTESESSAPATPAASSFIRIALISFGVLFAAEFGDGSQLATAGLAAHYSAPLTVFIGAWLAEMTVCGIAAVMGRAVLRLVSLVVVHRVAAGLFGIFAVVAAAEFLRQVS